MSLIFEYDFINKLIVILLRSYIEFFNYFKRTYSFFSYFEKKKFMNNNILLIFIHFVNKIYIWILILHHANFIFLKKITIFFFISIANIKYKIYLE